MNIEEHLEIAAFLDFRFNGDLTTHWSNDSLTNIKTKSSSFLVYRLRVLKFPKGFEQLLQILFLDAASSILNFNIESFLKHRLVLFLIRFILLVKLKRDRDKSLVCKL